MLEILEKIFRRRKEKSPEVKYRLKFGEYAGGMVLGEPSVFPLNGNQRNLYCFDFIYEGKTVHGEVMAKDISDLFEAISEN